MLVFGCLAEVSLVGVDILYSDSLSRNVAFNNCLMFMPEISNRMVFVNGKHPSLNPFCVTQYYTLGNVALRNTERDRTRLNNTEKFHDSVLL